MESFVPFSIPSQSVLATNPSDERPLVHFSGAFTDEERRLILTVVERFERATALPKTLTPWVVVSAQTAHRRVLSASRFGQAGVLTATSVEDLALEIHEAGPRGS